MAEVAAIAAAAPPGSARSHWQTARLGTGFAAGLLLGALFLVATYAKVLNPGLFVEWVEGEGLDFLLPAAFIGPLALAVEAALGLALVLGLRRWWNLVPTGMLIAVFLFLVTKNYVAHLQGLDAQRSNCGCFGNLLHRSPAEAFWQDLLVLVPLFAFCVIGREPAGSAFPRLRTGGVLACFVGVLGLYHLAPYLPVDDLVTDLKRGGAVGTLCVGEAQDRLCVGTLIPNLEAGEHVVVIASLEDPAFAASLEVLNHYALARDEDTFWAVVSGTLEEVNQFTAAHVVVFQIKVGPPELLRPLYRRLPRSFVVRDGIVTRTFDGLPPALPPTEPTGP
jgi:uncharacterized membrane protein YphA (DoxX/SURF4 family)